MDMLPPSMRDLAVRWRAASQALPRPDDRTPPLLSDPLRVSLTRFVGVDGYAALLRRAVSLAGGEFPNVAVVTIAADGRLEGLEQLVGATDPGDAELVIVTHLLGLLVTFIGEPLSWTLVQGAWPDSTLDE